MSTGTEGKKARKGPPRPDEVARAALALVDAGGLDSLTMRRLATSLGVQLPTIYRLFDGKQALLDEMSEMILTEVLDHVRPGGADWADRIAGFARVLREKLLAQRDGARIVGGNYAAKQPTLALADMWLTVMAEAGFAEKTAMWSGTTVFCYVLGEVLEQQGAAGDEYETLSAAMDVGRYPGLTTGSLEGFLDFDARFEFGLRVLLAGLKAECRPMA
ncbi:TetR/AcrR family transcriptional regulator C-terminal domain-containing protein [Nonomuraea sp. ZG12]|uniref:TetR/AcrR family transcriptional regulator C-terminal domain-containing protein n=1 Tax=Nonomuraea sp. ZG12 TaxID=3452207 RepID=UPI003F8A7A0C